MRWSNIPAKDRRWFAIWFVCIVCLVTWLVRMERADTARYAEIRRITQERYAPQDAALREAIVHPKPDDGGWFEPWHESETARRNTAAFIARPLPAYASSPPPAIPGR